MISRLFFIVLLCAFVGKCWADSPIDTVHVQQVQVKAEIPMNKQEMVVRYRATDLSNIDQIMSRLKGVALVSRGSYAKDPVIDGFFAGQINVTIDGMQMFGACTGRMDPVTSYVEPVNLKNIQVEQGTTGSSYGSTIGGALNLQLENAELNRSYGRLGGGFDQNASGKMAYFSYNLGVKRWAYRFSGSWRDFRNYKDGAGKTISFTQYQKFNLNQSLVFSPEKGKILSFNALYDHAADIGYAALPMDVSKAIAQIYSIDYKSRYWGNLYNLHLKVYSNFVHHVMDDSKRDSLYLVESSNTNSIDSVYMHMDMPGWSRTQGFYVQGNLNWIKNNYLFMKVSAYRHWSKAEMTMYMNNLSEPGEPDMYAETWPENRRILGSFYFKNDFQVDSKNDFLLSGRFDYANTCLLSETGKDEINGLGYSNVSSSQHFIYTLDLQYSHRFNSKWTLELGLGRGERLPTVSEQFGYYLFNAKDGYDYLGNPNLKREQSLNLRAGINYRTSDFSFSMNGVWSKVQNYIYGEYLSDYEAFSLRASGVKQYENLPYGKLLTLSSRADWKMADHIDLFNLLVYNYGAKSDGIPLPLIAPLNNRVVISYHSKKNFLRVENQLFASQNRIDQSFGEETTGAYYLLNMDYTHDFQFVDQKLKVQLGVNNLFDRVYVDHMNWGNIHAPGRNLYIRINYFLK